MKFSGTQALAVSKGFAKAIKESGYVVVACSLLPDHVHMVAMRHERLAERIIGHLKAPATQRLLEENLHPFADLRDDNDRIPSVWAQRGWKVFLDSQKDIQRAIKYVEENPLKEGKPKQSYYYPLISLRGAKIFFHESHESSRILGLF